MENTQNNLGQIHINQDVIAKSAGLAAMECYGLVGMASQQKLKDGVLELLRKDSMSKGIVVRDQDEELEVDLYVVVAYGTKIDEVARNVQEKVAHQLKTMLGIEVTAVNIFVHGVQIVEED